MIAFVEFVVVFEADIIEVDGDGAGFVFEGARGCVLSTTDRVPVTCVVIVLVLALDAVCVGDGWLGGEGCWERVFCVDYAVGFGAFDGYAQYGASRRALDSLVFFPFVLRIVAARHGYCCDKRCYNINCRV